MDHAVGVQELLARSVATSDRAERSALLTWAADLLDAAAGTAHDAGTADGLRARAAEIRTAAAHARDELARAAAGVPQHDRRPHDLGHDVDH